MASVQLQTTIPFSNPFQVLNRNESNGYLGEQSKTGESDNDGDSNGFDGEPDDLPQPVVTEITNDNEVMCRDMKRKKRDFTETINLILKSDCKDQQRNVDAGNEGSMVTVVKFQNGDFVESCTSWPTYNSKLSLEEMRQAITTSLESCLSQPDEQEKSTNTVKKLSPRSQSNSPKSARKSPISPCSAPDVDCTPPKMITSPKEKTKGLKTKPVNTTTVATATTTTTAAITANTMPSVPSSVTQSPSQLTMVKVKKEPSIKHIAAKKTKVADLESIKFANRQKELQKLKQEMKKKMKMEGTNPADIEALRSNLGSWGRTVGVLCTMCGNHVQKSYGVFRKDNAPPKLLYLFTPGMNRIKICRRCLPYKKQGNTEEMKKMTQTTMMVNTSMIPSTGQMSGAFSTTLPNQPQPATGVSTVTRPDHGLSTIDSTGLNLTPVMNDGSLPNNTMQPLVRPQMVIGGTPSSEPMNYVFDGKAPLPNYHSIPVSPGIPPNIITTTAMDGTINNQWAPTCVNQQVETTSIPLNYTNQLTTNYQPSQSLPIGSQPVAGVQQPSNTMLIPAVTNHLQQPMSTTIPASLPVNQQVNNQTIIDPQKQPAVYQQTPTTMNTHQIPGSHLPPPQSIVYQQAPKTTTSLQTNQASWPPFIVKQLPANDSTQMIPLNTTGKDSAGTTIPLTIPTSFSYQKPGNNPLKGPLFLQIQKIKVVKTNDEEQPKLELVNVQPDGNEIVSNVITKCKACCNVAKTLHCINKQVSPPHLKQLFYNDQELLVVCQKCLTPPPQPLPQVHGQKSAVMMQQQPDSGQQQVVDEDMKGTQGDQGEVIVDQQMLTVDQPKVSVHQVAVSKSGSMVDQPQIVVDPGKIGEDQTGTYGSQAGTMVDQAGTMVDQAGAMVDQAGAMVDQAGFVEDAEDVQVLCEDEPKVIVDKMNNQTWIQEDDEGIEVVNENKGDNLWACPDSHGSLGITEDDQAVSRDSIGLEEGSSGIGNDKIVVEKESNVRMKEDEEIMASIEKLYAEEVQKENDEGTKWNSGKVKSGRKRGRKRKNKEELDEQKMGEGQAKKQAVEIKLSSNLDDSKPNLTKNNVSSKYHNTRGAVLKYQREDMLEEPVVKRKRGRKPKNEEVKNAKQTKQSPVKKYKN